MKAIDFLDVLGVDYYAGVPDSLLRPMCDCIMNKYGVDYKHHVIAANEGNAVALAAGYYLATGKVGMVYMQNSGEGNAINPIASLVNEKVYGVPMLFVVGWRGEPGVHDEPQHIFQGEITTKILGLMGISYFIIDKDTTIDSVRNQMRRFNEVFIEGRQAAFVIKKGALTNENKNIYHNEYGLSREEAIQEIVKYTGDDPIVSTTGKASRELFEIRERRGENHNLDFLTVGSMGHASSIALEIAIQKNDKRIWCIDGDGAMIMHLGAMAVIGNSKVHNLVHIIIDNQAHESVGGLPTASTTIRYGSLAEAFGYDKVYEIRDIGSLAKALQETIDNRVLTLMVIYSKIGARDNLGRPTTTARENKIAFMDEIGK